MPDDFVMQPTDFENDSDFRPAVPLPQIRWRHQFRCVYRLLITCSFPSGGFIQRPAIRHP